MRISKIIFKTLSIAKYTVIAPFLLVIFIVLIAVAFLETVADILVTIIRLICLIGYSEYDSFIKEYEKIVKDMKSNLIFLQRRK